MIPAPLVLLRAQARLVTRITELETKIDGGDASDSTWAAYCEATVAFAALAPLTAPGAAHAMSTAELATAFGLTPRSARRKGLRGELPVAPIRLGPGGRAKLRWSAR
jgi:hypothetical protein